MRYGVREVCDVMVKELKDGKPTIPVCHFDSLKTSTLEQAVTTVYAIGGQGAPRLIAWDGEKVVTFTMEDALISKQGLGLLTGSKLIEKTTASNDESIIKHVTHLGKITKEGTSTFTYTLEIDDVADDKKAGLFATGKSTYVIPVENGEITGSAVEVKLTYVSSGSKWTVELPSDTPETITIPEGTCLVDGYTSVTSGFQVNIEPNKFAGTYYFEGSTLWRDTDGKDHAAEFIIPRGKIQSNFTFTMADTGDPSTFTFTVDAFPGYIVGQDTKKVTAAIQVVDTAIDSGE